MSSHGAGVVAGSEAKNEAVKWRKMTISSRVVFAADYAYIPFTNDERTADQLCVFVSNDKTEGSEYQNFRLPYPRGFFGYAQLFKGEAVYSSRQLEYQSQMIYLQNWDTPHLMARICTHADYVKQLVGLINQFVFLRTATISTPTILPPLLPTFEPIDCGIPTPHPDGIALKLEPNVISKVSISYYRTPISVCMPLRLDVPAPEGCWVPGFGPESVSPNCLPGVPSGGGGST